MSTNSVTTKLNCPSSYAITAISNLTLACLAIGWRKITFTSPLRAFTIQLVLQPSPWALVLRFGDTHLSVEYLSYRTRQRGPSSRDAEVILLAPSPGLQEEAVFEAFAGAVREGGGVAATVLGCVHAGSAVEYLAAMTAQRGETVAALAVKVSVKD